MLVPCRKVDVLYFRAIKPALAKRAKFARVIVSNFVEIFLAIASLGADLRCALLQVAEATPKLGEDVSRDIFLRCSYTKSH